MNDVVLPLLAVLIGVGAAWAMTVPLHSFKEFRPKTPRDVASEVDSAGVPTQIIRAAYREARCPDCHHSFSALDVIPVFSWARGCPECGRRLAWTVPLLQIGVPLAMLATALTLPNTVNAWVVLPYLWLVVVLAAISLVDLRIWLIPYWMPWVGAAVGLVLIAIVSIGLGVPGAIKPAILGAALSFLLFFILFIAAPGKLGFGDVRLALLLGMFLAWLHPLLPFYGLLFGSLLGVVMGAGSLIRKSDSRFAFGPALALGAMCAIWFSGPLLNSFG
ncbi:MAG TPA: A24 family peptidase [Microthrixaceae bacterium]|nr:A24 family peptidase [Microthrixaceae bacterium]